MSVGGGVVRKLVKNCRLKFPNDNHRTLADCGGELKSTDRDTTTLREVKMGTKELYSELGSNKSFEEVQEAVRKSFQIVGGEMQDSENGILIIKGTNQVKKAFSTMKFSATVDISSVSKGKYDLKCTINWLPHWFHFLMFLWGFVSVVTWIYNVLYFFVDPTLIYQRALDRVEFFLE